MNRNTLAWTFGVLAATAAALQAQGRVLTVDDFEDGDRRASSGLSWIPITDDLMGGASSADLSVTAPGPGSGRALRVSGEVAPKGFAGAWVPLDGRARATDVSDFAGIRLRVRGHGALRVAARGGPMPGVNYWAPVETRGDGTPVEVPFESLKATSPESPPFDPRSVRWLGVGLAANRTGPFEFEVDDVGLYAARDAARLRVQDGPTMAAPFKAAASSDLPQCRWKELAKDAPDDGKQKRLPDATAVATCEDEARDRIWFRVPLATAMPVRWLGVNLALDIDGDPGNGMAWWGTNQAFRFDRLVTVYGSAADSGYEGMIGIADAAEVEAGRLAGSRGEDVTLILDRTSGAFVVGIPRRALGTSTRPLRLVAAVGSAFQHNDDVPNEGAAVLVR